MRVWLVHCKSLSSKREHLDPTDLLSVPCAAASVSSINPHLSLVKEYGDIMNLPITAAAARVQEQFFDQVGQGRTPRYQSFKNMTVIFIGDYLICKGNQITPQTLLCLQREIDKMTVAAAAEFALLLFS